jgi:hypothetical protein
MGLKITGNGKAFEIEDGKRFYMPGVVLSDTCPKCKKKVKQAMEDNYLSYPTANRAFDHTMWCDACSHEWKVKLILNVELKEVT